MGGADPLLQPARLWSGETSYRLARNGTVPQPLSPLGRFPELLLLTSAVTFIAYPT
jgi:hypothetical protein